MQVEIVSSVIVLGEPQPVGSLLNLPDDLAYNLISARQAVPVLAVPADEPAPEARQPQTRKPRSRS